MSSTKVEHKPAASAEAAVVSKEGEHHSHSRGHHKKIGAANPTFKKLFNDGRPATLSDEDTLSYDTLKVYGPAIRAALQTDIQTKMLPEITGEKTAETTQHLAQLVGSMQATIYRSVAHMVMDETFVKKIASEMDRGTSEAASSGQVKSALQTALDTELEKSLSNELRQRLVPAMLDCVDSLTLKVTADQSTQVEELREALDSSQKTISLLSSRCKSLEDRVRSLAQKQQFAGSRIDSQLAEAVKELRALDKDADFARQFDTSALSPDLPSQSEAEIADQVLEQVRGQVIRPMLAQMRELQEEIRAMKGTDAQKDSVPSSPTLPGSSAAVRRQMNKLVGEGKWEDAFQTVVKHTLKEAEEAESHPESRRRPYEDLLQELLDMTASQPELWLSHPLPDRTAAPLSTRPDLKVELIEALTLQLRRPTEDVTITVVDSKMDWLRELTLSLSSSSIRGMPEVTELLSKTIRELKGLEQDPGSFVNSRNIRESDTAAQKLLLSKLSLIIRCMEALIR